MNVPSFHRSAAALAVLVILVLIVATPRVYAQQAAEARNRRLVEQYYTAVYIEGHVAALPRYVSPAYVQHDPDLHGGLTGLAETVRRALARPAPKDYRRAILRVVADDDVVVLQLRQSWTGPDGAPAEKFGLAMFRVADGKIAEQWGAAS